MALQPPDEIKSIVEKTASFVARLGIDFEKRIYEREKENPKFSFLTAGDIYYPFYQLRLQSLKDEFASSGTLVSMQSAASSFQTSTEAPPPAPPPSPPREDSAMKVETIAASEAPKHGPHSLAWRIWQVEKQVKNGTLHLEPPQPYIFVQDMPEDVTAVDLDVMRLTAQFVARNGHQFQMGLMNREMKNPQFDFLKPGHSHYNYFLGMVESYTRCLLPPKGLTDRLKQEYLISKDQILQKLVLQYEFQREEERKQKEKEAREKEETIAAAIDWHDFILVETILLDDEDDGVPVMPPGLESGAMQMEISGGPDAAMDTDDMEMEVEDQPKRPSAEIRVKRDYVRPSLAALTKKFQRCPRCNQDIPVEDMENHMRIELLDPRYVQQRAQSIDRSRTAEVASNDEISKNIGAFAKRRTDIFGEDEEFEIGKTSKDVPVNLQSEEKPSWDASHALPPMMKNTPPPKGPVMPPPPGMMGMHQPPPPPGFGQAPPPPGPPGMMGGMHQPPPPPGMYGGPPPPRGFGGYGQPPPPPGYNQPPPPAPTPDEPQNKRQKVTEDTPTDLVPEQTWIQQQPSPKIIVQVQIPQDKDEKSESKLNGQTLSIEVNLTDSVTVLKEKIKEHIGIAPNKQKLKGNNYHLKDDKSMAYYNFATNTVVQLAKRERGGKR